MTAPAPTDRKAIEERVLVAAIVWVSDKSCSLALADLDQAVEDLLEVCAERRRALLGSNT